LKDLGHPLHAFDYDKIENKLIIKNGFEGKFITLDDKERNIHKDTLMICDTNKPIAIAGIMGGKNSEISDSTTNVVLESAFFNPSSIRKSAKTLAMSTDASYRFERGADIDIAIFAVNKASEMIANLTGGKILKDIVEVYPNPVEPKIIEFRFDYARKIIGVDISNSDIKDIFKHLGFSLQKATNTKSINVIIPNRRVDILAEVDLIEEIARMINFNNITPNFASVVDFQRDEIPAYLKPLPLRNTIREFLSNNEFTELLTPNIIDPVSANLTHNKIIKIENPLGEDSSIMRPSMIPSILKVISFNLKQGINNLKIFETGKIFLPQNNITNSFIEGIDEREQLIITMAGNTNPRQ
jgi:phenylalanyl-tRNA synthetase beta chain